ncbi:hypothetical protein ZIOFF_069030 [Zingiber officinale]|uniref:Uncharacterized protein n=1 Tax=Zingiber officinale TaxID=94328 RepID=A0A8J5BG98_ZINOF|nr:hypothetical protein ZIOFF_069030 [Zingiber officinale]
MPLPCRPSVRPQSVLSFPKPVAEQYSSALTTITSPAASPDGCPAGHNNAAANDVFVGLLRDQLGRNCSLVSGGEFLHVRCCAHILNLIVQDGLKRIDSSADEIRECVKYVKNSQVRKQKFIESVTQTSLDSKKSLRQVDPRFKIQFVEFYYNKLYGYGSNELSLVRSKLVSLFEEYMHMDIASQLSTSGASSSSHNVIDDNASLALNLGSGYMDILKFFEMLEMHLNFCSSLNL